jgi:hypothetical protein
LQGGADEDLTILNELEKENQGKSGQVKIKGGKKSAKNRPSYIFAVNANIAGQHCLVNRPNQGVDPVHPRPLRAADTWQHELLLE